MDDVPVGKRRKTTGNKEKSRNSQAVSLTIQPGESIQHFNKSVMLSTLPFEISLTYILGE